MSDIRVLEIEYATPPIDGLVPVYDSSTGTWIPSDVSHQANIRTITVSSAVLSTDDVLLVNASAGNVTITLPSATPAGRMLTVKKIDVSGYTVILDAAGADTIDGAGTLIIDSQYDSPTIISDGAGGWNIV